MPEKIVPEVSASEKYRDQIYDLQILTGEITHVVEELQKGNTSFLDRLNKNLRALDRDKAAEWPEVDTWDGFLSNPSLEPTQLIEGVLCRGDIMSLSAPSKCHKTFAVMELAWRLSKGLEWLGHRTSPSKVLYLNHELSRYQFERRLRKIVAEIDDATQLNPNFFVMNLRGVSTTVEETVTQVRNKIAQHGIDVVILDPLYKMLNSSIKERLDENSNSDMEYLFCQLGNIIKDGATLIIVSHYAKGNRAHLASLDRMAGASLQGRTADVLMTIDKLGGKGAEDDSPKNAYRFEFTLRNFAPIDPISVSWQHPIYVPDESLGELKLEGTGGRPATTTASDVLAEWHKQRGEGFTVHKKVLAEQLACTVKTIERKVRELNKAGCLYKLRLENGNVIGEAPDLTDNLLSSHPELEPSTENLLRNMGEEDTNE